MRILGVDPGLTRCGLAVIDCSNGKFDLVFADTVRSSPKDQLADRVYEISQQIEHRFVEFKPETVALERVFAQANLKSVMATAQISGVVLYLARKFEVPIAFHTPSEVKLGVTGSGRADKAQVGAMVQRLLSLDVPLKPADTADACAIAMTHALRFGVAAGRETGSKNLPMTKAQQAWADAIRKSQN
jgi:crossover junction endodeoxyribonuclease RuvC